LHEKIIIDILAYRFFFEQIFIDKKIIK